MYINLNVIQKERERLLTVKKRLETMQDQLLRIQTGIREKEEDYPEAAEAVQELNRIKSRMDSERETLLVLIRQLAYMKEQCERTELKILQRLTEEDTYREETIRMIINHISEETLIPISR